MEAQETSPHQAQTAQIPLQSFTLPTFPKESLTSSSTLKHLILTSDINPSEYTSLLSPSPSPVTLPQLPPNITSLSLELFSLGYPPTFLPALSKALPNLSSLTIYSQLFAGTTKESREDALGFLAKTELREVHLLDVFLPKGFLSELKPKLGDRLQFLEVSYTFRHSEVPGEFLRSLNAGEIVGLLEGKGKEGLVGVNLAIREPDVVAEDEDDREGTEEGVLVIYGEGGKVVNALKGKEGLRLCDISMFELSVEEMGKVLDSCKEVVVLGISVTLKRRWQDVFEELGKIERSVEVLEIVGVPGEQVVERIKGGEEVGLEKELLEKLGEKWMGLMSVKTSILRTKGEEWVKGDEGWAKKT